jgi:ferric-dicitrate binding protein FerR (iron transport regulator)
METANEILQIVLGNLKKDRKKEIFAELDKDQEAREEFRKIKNIWALASSKKEMPEYELENLYLNFKRQLEENKRKFSLHLHSYWKYAAVFLLAIGLSSLFFYVRSDRRYTGSGPESHFTTVFADNAQISRIILPDSSVVWLNSGTKISYNSNFALNNREIKLNGQAFFQVKKNEKIPLKVFCNDLEVRVLGTRFDVSAYPEDKSIDIVLESGRVEMFNSKNKQFHYKMKPGEMVRYDPVSGGLLRENVDPGLFTSWKKGILIFRNDPMTEVISKLQRKYDVDIEVRQPEIYSSIFTATIKNETLEEIIKSISYACSVHYRIIKSNDLTTKTKVILTKN